MGLADLGRNKNEKIEGKVIKKGQLGKQWLLNMLVWPCPAPDQQSVLSSY